MQIDGNHNDVFGKLILAACLGIDFTVAVYQRDGEEANQSRYYVTACGWWLQVPQSVNNIITMEISILITFWLLSMPMLMTQSDSKF